MENIYKSDYSDKFIIQDEYFPLYEYKVYKEGENVFIKHLEVDKFAVFKLHYSAVRDKSGAAFNSVDSCVDYLINVVGDPVNDTEDKNLIKIESKIYLKRISDGVKMSRDLMSELRVNSKVNALPRAVNKYIEEKLERVKTNIDRGWWVTALEELESTTVESYFTQDLYDRIHLTLTEYIAENYD